MTERIAPDLQYTDQHEWVDDRSDPARVGITAVATAALGDVVYVDLPEVGAEVTAGGACGEVESTKSVSELYSPVTGTVVAVNDAAVDDPALIGTDPYGQGWLFTVAVTGRGALLSAQEYAAANDAEVDAGE